MHLVTFSHPATGRLPGAGVRQGDRVLCAGRLLGEDGVVDMAGLLERGPAALDRLAAAARDYDASHRDAALLDPETAVPIWEVLLHAPLPEPRSYRDFYAFEQHVATAYRKRGRPVPPAWDEVPVFFFGHAGTFVGPDAKVQFPATSRERDFELEVAAVIGVGGRNIPAEQAWHQVAGLTIPNDWSARDIQRQEMAVGLGPAKGKDFATSMGPAIVTLDELQDRLGNDGHHLQMVGRINDEVVSRGNLADLHWTIPEMVAHASRDVMLRVGDVIGTGTVGTGCLLEIGQDRHDWLQPGDEVELEVDLLGRLRNVVC